MRHPSTDLSPPKERGVEGLKSSRAVWGRVGPIGRMGRGHEATKRRSDEATKRRSDEATKRRRDEATKGRRGGELRVTNYELRITKDEMLRWAGLWRTRALLIEPAAAGHTSEPSVPPGRAEAVTEVRINCWCRRSPGDNLLIADK